MAARRILSLRVLEWPRLAPPDPKSVSTAPPDEGLVRALGLGSAVLFVLGSVIGSGIFMTTGTMAASLPSATLIIAAWVAGGVLALTGGLTYAEMGSMYPGSGGVYVYLREAFGPLIAFLYGWAALVVFFSGGIAAVAVGFSDYVSYFAPALSTARVLWSVSTPAGIWTVSAAQIVAVLAIAALAAINYVGVKSGNLVNVVLTLAKVIGLAALPVLALVASQTTPVWVPVVPPDFTTPLAGFGIAMIAVLWTNDAWYCVTWIAGEMKHPQRDLPRALFIGISLLTLIYVAVNLSYSLCPSDRRHQGCEPRRRSGGDGARGRQRRAARRVDRRRVDVRLRRGGDSGRGAPAVRDGARRRVPAGGGQGPPALSHAARGDRGAVGVVRRARPVGLVPSSSSRT